MKSIHLFAILSFSTFTTTILTAGPDNGSPVDKHTQRTSEHGDVGKFSGSDPDNANLLILWPGDTKSIVRRIRPATHTGAAPKAFKLWKNAGRSGGFPVNLKSSVGFCSFIRKIETSPGLNGCICDDTPGNTGGQAADCNPPITLAQCSPSQCDASDDKDADKPGEETGGKPLTPAHAACASWSTGSWSPSRARRCSGTRFKQTRRVFKSPSGCSGTPPGKPPRSSRTTTGTKTSGTCSTVTTPPPPPVTPCTATAWAPATGSQCRGITFTQSRNTCPGNIRRTRLATGIRCCGSATPWGPGAGTKCAGVIFTQSRINTCGKRETQQATGTRRCSPKCSYRCDYMHHPGGGSPYQLMRTCPPSPHPKVIGIYDTRNKCLAAIP